MIKYMKKKIKKNIGAKFKNFSLFKIPLNNHKESKLLAFLLSTTIIGHIIALITQRLTNGEIWAYGNRLINQKDLFLLDLDGGYFEHFQYIILLWCAALSLLITLRQSKLTFNIFIIYLFLFIDDYLSFHDRAYDFIIKIYKNYFFISQDFVRSKDIAEIIFWSLVLLLAICISLPSFNLGNVKIKNFIITNFKYFIVLSFFGKFIDILDSNILKLPLISESPALINKSILYFVMFVEEIGEITVISFICIWLFNIASKRTLISRTK